VKHEGSDSLDDDEDDTAEDVEFRGPDNARTGTAQKFQRWIQLLIAHWAALEQLSRLKGAGNACISLVCVMSAYHHGVMEPWDSTIRRLAALPTADKCTDPFDTERAINVFTNNVESPNSDTTILKVFHCWLKNGRLEALPTENVVFCGNIHCEMALVLLEKNNEEDPLLQHHTTVCIPHPQYMLN
jgi:hypothetical protein